MVSAQGNVQPLIVANLRGVLLVMRSSWPLAGHLEIHRVGLIHWSVAAPKSREDI